MAYGRFTALHSPDNLLPDPAGQWLMSPALRRAVAAFFRVRGRGGGAVSTAA